MWDPQLGVTRMTGSEHVAPYGQEMALSGSLSLPLLSGHQDHGRFSRVANLRESTNLSESRDLERGHNANAHSVWVTV